MALNNIRIGDYVTLIKEKCSISNLTPDDVSGINRDKEFFEPSKQVGGDTSNYKIVPPGCFACNLMHVGRDCVLPIALNRTDKNKIVSPAYTVFKLNENDKILVEYFFILLNSQERDRYFWFHCDSSVRDGMEWSSFCDIKLEIPSIEIQKKYVAIYEGLLANLRSYEKGLDDISLVCDGYIEDLRKKCPSQPLGNYIEIVNETNENSLISNVQGVSAESEFIDTKANLTGVKLSNYTIVAKNMFAYNPSRINIGSIALYKKDEPCIVSPMYVVFRLSNNANILPEYLMLWLSRREFLRSTLFYASGSVRDVFSFELMKEVKIPIPDLTIQKDIVNVFDCLSFRKNKLKMISTQIENICPILIRGSISEAKGLNNYE